MTDNAFETNLDRTTERAVESLTAIFGPATPGTIFSEPEQVGDHLVFTASAWDRAGGFAFGGGGGTTDDGGGSGLGVGGGGASQGRPVAVIRIGPDGVTVVPVVDLTKIAVTALLAGLGVWSALRR